MSMITELIERLRTNANWLDEEDNDERAIRKSMLEAADTIQLLSEKIRASQMKHCEDIKDALHIAQTDRDKWKTRAKKLAKIIGIRDCDIDKYKQEPCEDCISRQAALLSYAELRDDDVISVRTIRDNIRYLPTVQPKKVIRCKDCKWFGKIGCAISIVDDSDKPTEDDFCSFAEAKMEGSEANDQR